MEFSSNFLHGKRAILYTRVSTDDQVKGFSLPAQKEQLEKWCQENGVQIVVHYQEDGASAKSFDRPEFKKILELLGRNKNIADYFLVVKWDRFSRNTAEALTMIDRFAKLGIIVNATEQWIDFSIPEQDFMLAFYTTNAHVENKIRSNRTRTGMRRALKEGNWVHQAPKGYSFVDDPERPGKTCLVPNSQAPLIQEAFAKVSEGVYSVSSILNMLNKKGFQCSLSHFHRLLRSLVYLGKTTLPSWKENKEEIVQGRHQAIVSEDLFYRVQEVLSGKIKTRVRKNPNVELFSLKGFLFCPRCNTFLTASFSKGKCGKHYPYYHCKKGSCPSRYPLEKINTAFLAFLRETKISSRVAELYHQVMRDIFKNHEKSKNQQKMQLEKKIEDLQAKLLKAELTFMDGDIKADSFNRVKEVYDRQLTECRSQKATLQTLESDYDKYLVFGLSLLSNLDFYYESASMEVKQKMVSSIFGKKLIFEGERVRTPETNQMLSLLTRFGEVLEEDEKKTDSEKSLSVSFGDPKGIRTPVARMKIWSPRPD